MPLVGLLLTESLVLLLCHLIELLDVVLFEVDLERLLFFLLSGTLVVCLLIHQYNIY